MQDLLSSLLQITSFTLLIIGHDKPKHHSTPYGYVTINLSNWIYNTKIFNIGGVEVDQFLIGEERTIKHP